jgi:hypothetical protein
MNSKRRILLAALLATSTTAPANAGCLDWLFGRPAASTYPYAAGYTPQATIMPVGPPTLSGTTVAPYSAGYAPYTAGYSPYSAGYAPYTAGYAPYTAGSAPYAAGYAGLQPTVAAQAPSYGAAIPAYGVAIPAVAPVTAYSLPLNNPSVLTGRPVVQTSYYGAAALPPAAMAPAPQQPTSLFGRMFGNSYQTSYYGVPTTSYRPVTQVDPTTGALTTVQQPCTSLTQQVQRSPYTSLQPPAPAAIPYYGEPTCGSESLRYAPPTTFGPAVNYAPQTGYPPVSNYAAPSGVSQATAIAPINGADGYGAPGYGATNNNVPGYASPIPATGNFGSQQQPYGGLPAQLSQPNSQPLTGYPGGAMSSDSSQIPVPQLDAYRPAWSSPAPSASQIPTTPNLPPSSYPPSNYPSTSVPSTSYPATSNGLVAPPLPPTTTWPTTSAAPTTSTWPDRRDVRANENFTETRSSATPGQDKYSDIAPIPAADNYRAPAWSELYMKPNATPVDSGRDRSSKPLPPSASLAEPRTASSDRTSQDGSLRYASTPTNLPPLPAPTLPRQEPPRDDSGWFAIEPR